MSSRLLLVCGLLCLAACAAPLTPAPAARQSPSPVASAAGSQTSAASGSAPAAPATEVGSTIVPSTATVAPLAASATPKQALLYALQLVDGEMRAARAGANLADTRRHAEAALNVCVGTFGRWYGDGDRNGKAVDPSDGRGILPGERVPGPPPDVGTPVFPFGLVFLALGNGGSADQAALAALLGDVEQWRQSPRGGYDAIAGAVTGAGTRASLAKLGGSVPRVVAAARLILAAAQTPAEAQQFAILGSDEASAALQAARQSGP